MGLYVELMCDVRSHGVDQSDKWKPLCWSDRNYNPDGPTIREARAEGRALGWKVGPGNSAICPGCLSVTTTKEG